MHTRLVRKRLRISCAVLIGALLSASADAGSSIVVAAEPTNHGSTVALRDDAVRALPLNKLTPQGKQLATKVLNDVTIFRRLPPQLIECDTDMYGFLVDNPDLVINIWEVMGVTKVIMNRLGPTSFRLNDGNGTTGDIHYLYRSNSQHVLYCEGTYTGSMLPRPIRGRCILSLRSAHVRDASDREFVQCRLDSFVQLDNVGVELFAKTFQNAIGGIADHNFKETTGFVSSVSRAAEASPESIHRIAAKLQKIPPQTKLEFTEIGDQIWADSTAASQRALTSGGPILTNPGDMPTARRPDASEAKR